MPQRIPSLVLHFINTTTFAARDFRPRRGASDAHTLQGSVRREQRRRGRKERPAAGLRRFSVLALLLLGHPDRSGRGMLPSSRLARTEKRRNKRGRIYEMGYLAAAARTRLRPSRQRLGVRRSSAALNSWTGRRKASYRTNSLLGLDGI